MLHDAAIEILRNERRENLVLAKKFAGELTLARTEVAQLENDIAACRKEADALAKAIIALHGEDPSLSDEEKVWGLGDEA